MTDVGAVMSRLMYVPAVDRSLARAAGRPITAVDRARLTVLAFLHDIGKANAGFQGRYWADSKQRPAGWNTPHSGHGPQGWGLFEDAYNGLHWPQRIIATLPVEAMDAWGDAWLNLLHASISHHGRPVKAEGSAALWQAVASLGQVLYDPAQAVATMGAEVQTQYPQAFVQDAPELPDTAEFTHLFAGLVQLADWLGSDTRPGFFLIPSPVKDAQKRLQHLPKRRYTLSV